MNNTTETRIAYLERACLDAFTFLSNVNAIDLELVVESLVNALTANGHNETELREAAVAVFRGAAGAGALLPGEPDPELERISIDSAVNRPHSPPPGA